MTEEKNRVDWDKGDSSRYRRPRRRVEVRQRSRWKQGLVVSLRLLAGLAVVVVLGAGLHMAYQTARASEVFRLESLEQIDVVAQQHVEAAAVRERFQSDIGQPSFSIPLAKRRRGVEEISWVESATVQRTFPDRLRVYIQERTPVAFLRQGNSLWLVDSFGVLLPPPEGSAYSFPILSGVSQELPQADRKARVEQYLEFVEALDRDGKNYSRQISEIDLSVPENLRAGVAENGGVVSLLFGSDRYQEKYETYLEHRALWQQSGEVVQAVELRYRGQIVLNPDLAGVGGGQ